MRRPTAQRNLVVHAATDVGLVRSENEDSHAIWTPDGNSKNGALLVIADGMGGAVAGEIASRLTVETVVRGHCERAPVRGADGLRRAIEDANREVLRRGCADQNLNGMGTTCTTAVIRDREIAIAHVGDSRAYLIRGDRIWQLTQDHSLVAQLVERREISAESARRDPRRNLMTRCVGVAENVEVDTLVLEPGMKPGDTLLLCSDGLHGQIPDAELAEIAAGEDLVEVCRQLVARANDNGGPDNITVVVARLVGKPSGSADDPGDAKIPFRALIMKSVLLFLLVSVTVAGALWWVYDAISG